MSSVVSYAAGAVITTITHPLGYAKVLSQVSMMQAFAVITMQVIAALLFVNMTWYRLLILRGHLDRMFYR
jgi:hypothetical protein